MLFSVRFAVILFFTLFALLLVGYFLPLSMAWRMIGSLLVLLSAGYIGYYQRRHPIAGQSSWQTDLNERLLPAAHYQGSVILVDGDLVHSGYFTDQPIRITRQGCYIAVKDGQLFHTLAQLLHYRPQWRYQVVTLYLLAVEQHQDRQVLIAQYQQFSDQRQQIEQHFHFSPAAICMGVLDDSQQLTNNNALWFSRQSSLNNVWMAEQQPQPLTRWLAKIIDPHAGQQAPQNAQQRYYYAQQATLYWHWLEQLATETSCQIGWRLITLCFTPARRLNNNLWQQTLYQHSGLVVTSDTKDTVIPYPDQLLPALPKQRYSFYQLFRFRGFISSALLFIACALIAVNWNNQQLLYHVASDLAQDKLVSQDNALQQASRLQIVKDANQLNQWYQQGEPIKLSLGLYQGETLRLPLLNYLSQHPLAKAAVQKPVAITTLALPSLALFNPGEARLKPEAEKSLVDLLLQLSAHSQQKITIIGYTDNTGSSVTNQQLSLARANAVRDWLMKMGHFSAHCLISQGAGASSPIADNRTVQGRAKNRRVTVTISDMCRRQS